MSERAVHWLLFGAALVAAPLPIAGLASAVVPPLHQLELGALALAFTLAERAHGIGLLIAALFFVQALGYTALLWLAAGGVARVLRGLPPLTRTRAACFLVVLGLALAIAEPVYRTPYSPRSAHSNLLGVYR
jgi:hypothetical protein